MSTAFTPPANTDWQTLLDEIVLAWNERNFRVAPPAPPEWDVGVTYNLNQIVTYEGDTWISLIASNTGNIPPGVKIWWTEIQEWDALTTYNSWNDVVVYENVVYWIGDIPNTGHMPGLEGEWWWYEEPCEAWDVNLTYWWASVSYEGKYWISSIDEHNLGHVPGSPEIAWMLYSDSDVQSVLYWRIFQNGLEGICTSFINHVSGPLNVGATAFLYFTLATWRTAAGLNAGGFRRAQVWDGINNPVWLTEGVMQKGDIIGPWVFEDLQKGMSALRWSIRTASWGGGSGYGGDSAPQNANLVSWETVKDLAEASRQSVGGGVPYSASWALLGGSTYNPVWQAWFSSKVGVPQALAEIFRNSFTFDLYIKGGKPTPYFARKSWDQYQYDDQGIGIAENVFTYNQSNASVPGSGGYILPDGTAVGTTSIPTWCNAPIANYLYPMRGYTLSGGGYLLKMDFSNQNA